VAIQRFIRCRNLNRESAPESPEPPVIDETLARIKFPRTPVTVRASPPVAAEVSTVVYCASESTMAVCSTMLTAEGAEP